MATMPLWQEQQLTLRQWQRCLHIDGNNTITTRGTTPAWQQATRATMLAWWWWRCLPINNNNDAIMTMAKMPASINLLTMAPITQPCSQDACRVGSCTFAPLGWAEGLFGIDWVEFSWSPLNQFHLNSFLRFYPPKLPLFLVSFSPNCPHYHTICSISNTQSCQL